MINIVNKTGEMVKKEVYCGIGMPVDNTVNPGYELGEIMKKFFGKSTQSAL